MTITIGGAPMRKLKKKFTSVRKTVEAMDSSCLNGCSCSIVTCICPSTDPWANYSETNIQQNYLKAAYKIADY